jgi:hypothetical protein
MTWRRAAHYTRNAFLTFLVVAIPGIIIQSMAIWLLSVWRSTVDNWPDNPALIGMVSVANGLAGLWVQFAILFVVFKYLPVAILEVQENREAKRVDEAARTAKTLKQYPS